jgi:hypothetical protein
MREGLALKAGRGNVESKVGPGNADTHHPDPPQTSPGGYRSAQPTLHLLL